MIDERKTAIITYIDEFFLENLEKDFLKTLYDIADYKGRVYLLNYGISASDMKHIAEKYPITIIECKKERPVFSNRYFDIPKVIDSLSDEIDCVMTMDCGDIWFQNNINTIFEQCKDGIGCVVEERIIGEDHFTDYCLNNLTDEERKIMEERLLGKKVRNSGVICGPTHQMKKIIETIASDMLNTSCEFFGIDQLYFNYKWYALEENEKVELSDEYNYVLVSNVDCFTICDDIIYDQSGKKVTVVHNAGANWRVLKRPYENKFINEEQYTDIRNIG